MAEGLGGTSAQDWPKLRAKELELDPIDRLAPGVPLHATLLKYLIDRIEQSEREMVKFYPRWRAAELRAQAFIDRKQWEKALKEDNDKGKTPAPLSVVVPYSFATISTIVTYLIHTFAGRKPMFQIGSYKNETVQNARMMELVMQYNSDHTRLVRHLFQFLNDSQTYGLGVLLTQWEDEYKMRTVWKPQANVIQGIELGQEMVKTRENRLVYSGNTVNACDPFLFFPDPNVPMAEVNRRGEYVAWRQFVGKNLLLGDRRFRHLRQAGDLPVNKYLGNESERSRLSQGEPTPGYSHGLAEARIKNTIQLDRISVDLIPAELGLGESTRPEKWFFSIANKKQIVEAHPLELDHDMHPCCVVEPYTFGYGFGQPGLLDFVGDLQDLMSWFVNSHIDNVRTALNNMFVVDPSRIVMKDLAEPGPGKIVRVKESAQGQDIRSMFQQLQVYDVTGGHAKDFELIVRIADGVFGVNDNLRGVQDPGGRKTATEVRTAGEAGASRLAALARLISAQGLVDLTEQMSINIQQNLDDDFFIDVVGMQGLEAHVRSLGINPQQGMQITPEMVTGDFYYPIHDGTLPLDRVALLDVWKEIFQAVIGDPELRQQFSVVGIFEHIAELGGAKNLDQFKNMNMNVQAMPDDQVMERADQGQLSPMNGPTPGVPDSPGRRLAGAF